MKRTYHTTLTLLLLGLMMIPATSLFAQDREARTVIEIKDGKVYMNGEEIAELEKSDAPVLFKQSGEQLNQVWFSDDGPGAGRSGFVLRSDDDAEGFRVRSMPRSFGYVSRDGGEARFFGDRNLEGVFEMRELAEREGAKAMVERMANLEGRMPAMSMYSELNAMSEEAREADMRTRELAREIRGSDGNTDELEAELDELLGRVFDEKEAAQQERVDELRQRLTELEERLAQRRNDRQDIIAKRKDQLLGRNSRYDW